jgi:hypothetical protein
MNRNQQLAALLAELKKDILVFFKGNSIIQWDGIQDTQEYLTDGYYQVLVTPNDTVNSILDYMTKVDPLV